MREGVAGDEDDLVTVTTRHRRPLRSPVADNPVGVLLHARQRPAPRAHIAGTAADDPWRLAGRRAPADTGAPHEGGDPAGEPTRVRTRVTPTQVRVHGRAP